MTNNEGSLVWIRRYLPSAVNCGAFQERDRFALIFSEVALRISCQVAASINA